MSMATEITISTEQVDLLSVIGQLDDEGLARLRKQLGELCDTGTQYLLVDLAKVTSCDHQLFDVLLRTYQTLTDRQGWMRLVGVGPTVINALDQATLAEYLLVCHASDWVVGGLI
jgi:anti-anti-sigma factor